MDKDKYISQLISFYSYNFYLEKIPLEMYNDEKLGVKCVVMRLSDNPDQVMVASAGLSLLKDNPPVEAVIFTTKARMEEEKAAKLIKEALRELMEKEYDPDCFNGSSSYPGLYNLSDEFDNHFGKSDYVLEIRNGGDPVFLEGEDESEDRVAFIVAPVFLTPEQYIELVYRYDHEGEDSYYDYLCEIEDEEDYDTLK